MKKIYQFLFLTIVILTSVFPTSAATGLTPPPVTIPVIPVPKDDEEPLIPYPPIKHRLPARMVSATIDSEGTVCIEGVNETVLTYEIRDAYEETIGVFSNSVSFCETLFSLEGEYEVRFTTSEYVYIGYVWME